MITVNHKYFFVKLYHENKIKNFIEIIEILKKFFENRIYFEIQRHNEIDEKNYETHLLNISKNLEIPLIASQEVFYLEKNMYEAHDALICIGQKNFVDDNNRFKYSNEHFIKKNKELILLLRYS